MSSYSGVLFDLTTSGKKIFKTLSIDHMLLRKFLEIYLSDQKEHLISFVKHTFKKFHDKFQKKE